MNTGFIYSKSGLWLTNNIRVAGVLSVTPPAMTATIGNYKASWMDMATPVDTGMEPMQADFKVGADTDVLTMFGFIPGNSTQVQLRRTYRDTDGVLHTFVDEMEGIIGTITSDDAGTDSKESVGMSVTLNLSYYKLTVDGTEIYEIDPANMIRSINGVNTLADEKDALLM